MTKAIWNNVVLADSDHCKIVEGNAYFPPDSINQTYFRSSDKRSTCFWKGVAHYYDIIVAGETNRDAAWFYPETSEDAVHIKNHIAFWKGVKIEG